MSDDSTPDGPQADCATLPVRHVSWWRFVGPAFIVSIGYFDPGNWATDLQAGSEFNYALLWVISASCIIGMFYQVLAAKLGIATAKDLARHCRDDYPAWLHWPLFLAAVVSMMATDLAEIIGVAVALKLLFGISLLSGAVITFIDVLLILLLNRWGYRIVESTFFVFLTTVAGIYIAEVFFAEPDFGLILFHSFVPDGTAWSKPSAIVITVGVIGATIMPHNLYLHSGLVISRVAKEKLPTKTFLEYTRWDTIINLTAAWFINAAILIVAAAVFHPIFLESGKVIASFEDAYETLAPALGSWASITFAVALLISGVASSTAATLAGQYVFEGFLKIENINLFYLRLGTRIVTMAPAILCIVLGMEPIDVLVWSQVILSLQLPFALFPLLHFTAKREYMGKFTNGIFVSVLGWVLGMILLVLNVVMLWQQATGYGS
ncbi:Divalent metal cation transporter MntH [Planctomycetes bacterium Pan216]|uniref:Divalent metal cation transporter MntH n=1 Tax=Kolteria novifilia TaxID=2527975 RepID=A0A518B9H6_9BACT|nr:Divalent metal cation transporter MntH [Planctomycetes bacterium Pan216]